MKFSNDFEELLKNQIIDGTLKPGDKLPTEKELITQYNLSKMSIRKTISKLKNYDLLYAVVGSGVYVSDKWRYKKLKTSNFFNTDITKMETFRSNYDIPQEIINKITTNHEIIDSIKSSNFFSYARLYYNKSNKIMSYSVSWIYSEGKKSNEIHNIIDNDKNDIHKKYNELSKLIYPSIYKQYVVSSFKKLDNFDRGYFIEVNNSGYVSENIIYEFDENENILKIQILKIDTKFFRLNFSKTNFK